MKRKSTISAPLLGAALAIAALMSLPAGAGAHATVTPFQPQTSPLTAARTLYVLRVPNEHATKGTYKVSLYVPAALQEAIAVRQVSDWKVRLRRRDTGKVNEGAKLYAIEKITWTARKGATIEPGFFGDFFLRWQNPVAAGTYCFPVNQYYRATGRKRQKPETVRW
ncbi:MAG: DUF1775 domain-containing protein, partial [Solirubrobacterales bacterium]